MDYLFRANRQIHPPLDLGSRQIRLLSFLPGGDLALRTYDNLGRPEYVALSYEWVDAAPVETISLNGAPLTIRRNLSLALVAIARNGMGYERRHKWEHLWVDALCIDQDNIDEREHQVRWEPDSSEIMEYFMDGDEAVRLGDLHTSFFFATYWTRMWIIQEFVLAKRILFIADSQVLEWSTLTRRLGTRWFRAVPKITIMHRFFGSVYRERIERTSLSRNSPTDIFSLVAQFGKHKCADPRDKVYSMLGLVEEHTRDVRVD